MNNLNKPQPNWGFYSADGTLVPITQLTTSGLAYVSYSTAQLQAFLTEKLSLELYEQCALIRDELLRRHVNKQVQ